MAETRFALRDCKRVLVSGHRYVIGELRPSGFGLWAVGAIFPIATFPEHLGGWNAVVDQFLALGDRLAA